MRIKLLDPWIRGNNSITPENFFKDNSPDFEMGMFLSLDESIDLYLAHKFDSGNLTESWKKTREYVEESYELIGREYDLNDDNFDWTLDNEERYMILDGLGEPPLASYNIYMISIVNPQQNEEKVVYIGKTNSKDSRFANGHLAALKLHNPCYNNYQKKVYFGTLVFITEHRDYLPLEFISSLEEAKDILDKVEKMLISHFQPELNSISLKYNKSPLDTIIIIENFNTGFLHGESIYSW